MLRVVLGGDLVLVLVFLWLGALVGKNDSGVNLTPTFVYVFFWIFMPILSAMLGNVWSVPRRGRPRRKESAGSGAPG